MKKIVGFLCAITIISVITIKAYREYDGLKVSDIVLANIEALADRELNIESPDIDVVCSAKCNDGIGRCWLRSGGNFCVFSGSQEDSCTGYGCKMNDGTIYY